MQTSTCTVAVNRLKRNPLEEEVRFVYFQFCHSLPVCLREGHLAFCVSVCFSLWYGNTCYFTDLEVNSPLILSKSSLLIYQGFGFQSACGAYSAYSFDLASYAEIKSCTVSMSNVIYTQRVYQREYGPFQPVQPSLIKIQ